MTILHMETDTVRATAGQLVRAAELIRTEMQSAIQSANNADWEGASRNQFTAEVASISRQVDEICEQAITLSQRCQREVDEWEQMASQIGESGVTAPFPFIVPIVIIGGSIGGILLWGTQTLNNLSIEEVLKKIEDILDNSVAGRKALEEAKRLNVKFELNAPGQGTMYDPGSGTMYIDPNSQPDSAASGFIHEVTHASQKFMDPKGVEDRSVYITDCIKNEADAVIAELKYEKENLLLNLVSQPSFEKEYWDAYNQKLDNLKISNPSLSTVEMEKIANEFGREKIIAAFNDGTIKTSTTGQSYVDYYGDGWENAHNPTNLVN